MSSTMKFLRQKRLRPLRHCDYLQSSAGSGREEMQVNDADRHKIITDLLRDTPVCPGSRPADRLGVTGDDPARHRQAARNRTRRRKSMAESSAFEVGGRPAARPSDENRDIAVEAKRQSPGKAASLVRDGDLDYRPCWLDMFSARCGAGAAEPANPHEFHAARRLISANMAAAT